MDHLSAALQFVTGLFPLNVLFALAVGLGVGLYTSWKTVKAGDDMIDSLTRENIALKKRLGDPVP